MEGKARSLLRAGFDIHVDHASTSIADDENHIVKMPQIHDTNPYEKDTNVPSIFRPGETSQLEGRERFN